MRPIGVRHEQAATFAAAAYGYVKNQVGVAVLAAGPGVTNGVTGAHVAYDNCWPLLILGGSGPQKGRGTGTFQETENVPMFKGLTKMAVQVDSTARLPEYMAMAFRKARTGRPGPVYLDLPSDVLQGTVEEAEVRWVSNTPEIRYDKILEAFGGHTEHVTDPDNIRPALARAYHATQQGQVACVNVIADPQESMATRSRRAGALMGYGRE
jgi:thiamine pyrophosphate-dependent acetolactate synthase large subunit-like protein